MGTDNSHKKWDSASTSLVSKFKYEKNVKTCTFDEANIKG
jgi:hypothetical protein